MTEPSRSLAPSCAALVAFGALGGCVDHAHVHMKNAPGITDLSQPLEHEDGDPQRFEPAREPGQKTLTVFAVPSLMIGAGREPLPADRAAYEPGLELRFEHHTADDREPLGKRALAVTAGVGFAQLVETRAAIGGPLFGELNYRFPTWNGVPTDIGVGPVVYPANFEAGGQITARMAIVAARARYLADSGLELWIGFQLPIPFFFGQSR
jgi:hypothetical protein